MRIKFFAISVLLTMCFANLFSQAKEPELQKMVERSNDTAGINALMNYGVELVNVDNVKAKEIFHIALDKSKRIGYDYGIGSNYARLGYIVGHEGKHREAIE